MRYAIVVAVILLMMAALYISKEVPWVRQIDLTGKYQLSEEFIVDFPMREFEAAYYADGGSYVFGMIDSSGKTFFVTYPYDTATKRHDAYSKAYLIDDPNLLKQPLKAIPTGLLLDRKVSDPFIYSLAVKFQKQEVIDHIWLHRSSGQRSLFNW
jgi:hypothetical protein